MPSKARKGNNAKTKKWFPNKDQIQAPPGHYGMKMNLRGEQ